MLNENFMSDLMNRAHQIRQSLEKTQREIRDFKVTGRSSGNEVTVAMDGSYSLKNVNIAPNIINNKSLLEKGFMESVNDATKKIEDHILNRINEVPPNKP